MKTHLYEVVGEDHPFRKGVWFTRKGRTMFAIVDKEKWWGAKMVGYSKLFKEWLASGAIKEL